MTYEELLEVEIQQLLHEATQSGFDVLAANDVDCSKDIDDLKTLFDHVGSPTLEKPWIAIILRPDKKRIDEVND